MSVVCQDTCGVCPAQLLGPGRFDVAQRPATDLAYNKLLGWRATPAGTPVCVHPFRVGMPPGQYASAGAPVPDLTMQELVPPPPPEVLELPAALDDLGAWFVTHLRACDGQNVFGLVARLEEQAVQRFAPGEVVAVLRRVLSVEMARV